MRKLLVVLAVSLLLASCEGSGGSKSSSAQASDDFELRFASGRLVSLILWDLVNGSKHINKDKANQFLETVEHVTSEQISRAYLNNMSAADKRFKGKRVVISGSVSAISQDEQGNPELAMPGPRSGTAVRLGFGKDSTDRIAAAETGRPFATVCTVSGFADDTVMMDNCQARPGEAQMTAAQELVKSIVKGQESIAPAIDTQVVADYYLAKELPADSPCRDRANFGGWFDDCRKDYYGLIHKLGAQGILEKLPEDLRDRFKEGMAAFMQSQSQ